MMITKKVEVKIASKNINHYKNKGYNCKINEIIIVKIEDLSKGSHEKIKVKCDICGKENEMTYHSYNNNFYNCDYHYSCSKCSVKKTKKTNLERYGVEYPAQNLEIYEKNKKTNLERYGVENVSKNQDILNKSKKTNLKRYGVENVSKSEEIKKIVKKTNLERYGVEYIFQNQDMLNKSKKTNLERYGVEYPLQNLEIFNKI